VLLLLRLQALLLAGQAEWLPLMPQKALMMVELLRRHKLLASTCQSQMQWPARLWPLAMEARSLPARAAAAVVAGALAEGAML